MKLLTKDGSPVFFRHHTIDAVTIRNRHREDEATIVDVSPHVFQPMRRLLNFGRCRACYLHRDLHPTDRWVPARPMYDKTFAVKTIGYP